MTPRAIEIVGEVANAHQGDPEQAAAIAINCHEAGADAVKFQIYFADELLVSSHPRFEHFRNQSFDSDTWHDLISTMKAKGVRVYCDVFGTTALEVAESCDVDGYKIHSSDLGNGPLLAAVRETGKPLYLSAGGCTARELAYSIRTVRRDGGPRPVLMHGYQSFPTAMEDTCLVRLEWLRRHFGAYCDIGYQDHVDGGDPFAVHLPLMAVGAGARVIEKHATLRRADEGVDYYSSLDPDAFAAFVATLRRAEASLGERPDVFTESEWNYRRVMKKFWVAARALPKGHVLADGDLVLRRVADGPRDTVELDKLAGRPLLRDVDAEHPLIRADVKQTVWATVVARSASTRMPSKATADVAGMATVSHLLERLKQATTLDRIILCTTREPEDDAIAEIAAAAETPCHRGPVEDVLQRMLGSMEGCTVDVVVRITGDDILVDPDYLDRAVNHHLTVNAEYSELHELPSGTEVEVFDFAVLADIHHGAVDPEGTEYLTWYVTRNGDQFRRSSVPIDEAHRRDWRLTIDTPEDHEVIRRLLEAMKEQGKALTYRLDDIVAFFEDNPDILKLNSAKNKRSRTAEVDTRIRWSDFV